MQRREFIKFVGGLSLPLIFPQDFTIPKVEMDILRVLFPSQHKNLFIEKTFLLVIRARDYMTALEFSLGLLPVISAVKKIEIKAAVMYPRQVIFNNQERIKELITRSGFQENEIVWKCKEILSPPKIKKWLSQLIDQGINTLLFTDEFLEWFLRDKKEVEFFEDSMEILDETAKKLKLTVISAHNCISAEDERYHFYFAQMNSLFTMSISDIMKFMISDFEIIPHKLFSFLPCVIWGPQIKLPPQRRYYTGNSFPIKMEVRFPESSYKNIYSQIHEPTTLISPYLDFELLKQYTGDIMVNVTWPRG
ncbi:MAG TPA: hypothetical protein DCY12_06725 [Candidatus Atribacteria bacterium]|nr:hypothetical protein [Candidatus Atribacteria bacterium]